MEKNTVKINAENLTNSVEEILDSANQDLIQENANTDGTSPMGMMGLFASELSKEYGRNLLNPEVLEAFEEGFIHIHDFDYYTTGTTTCSQIPLGEVLERGFTVGTCYMRKPKSIGSAMALASIIIQANQNQQHGGQSYPNWDYDLAPYVEQTYNEKMRELTEMFPELDEKKKDEIAIKQAEKDTYQATEAFVHNANSMLCRNGMQVPFVSINFGLDTSRFGRIVTEQTLKAQMAGLGDGSTPLFPILVFKVKEGINVKEEDPNYDLYRLGLECLSKRLFPNFQFVDTPFNSVGFDINNPRTHIATMGCRTRVLGNVNGEVTPVGRGNNSFTTLNLPMIAQKSEGNIEVFYAELKKYIDLAVKQLEERLVYQKSRQKRAFKFLYGEKIWENGTDYDLDGEVGDILDQGSQSVGFVGLAEALIILTGSHQGESEESQKVGLEIIRYMRCEMDEYAKIHQQNYTLLATPAESYAGKACTKFINKYGKIDRVTDKEFFTNSNHVPVDYQISVQDKIKIEAPYHELTNAGHIAYVEVDGAAAKNVEALDDVVKLMSKYNIGYGSINHPVDRCVKCGYNGLIDDACPKCGDDEISRIRRITGYIVGDMSKWNTAKKKEESMRVKHGKTQY